MNPSFKTKFCNSAIIKNLERLKQYSNLGISIESIITNETGIDIENLYNIYSFILNNNYKWVLYTDFNYRKKKDDDERLSKLFHLVSPAVFEQ
jgi:hypothetical protein